MGVKRIDIAKVIGDKNPALARWTPRFVIKMIEKLVAAKYHNEILERYEHLAPIEFIDSALDYIGVKYELHSVENLPLTGRLLFAANHPLGGVDGMILAAAIEKIRPNVRLIVNDILLNVEPLQSIFVGINKHGRQAADSARKLDELYRSQSPIINFAAGLCSRRVSRTVIEDLRWKPSFVVKCIENERIVIPTYVDARNSKFFYFLGWARKKLGIKTNLEMMLLPREVFFQKGKVIHIYFAQPVMPDRSLSANEWCDLIRERVYQMAKSK